MEEIIIFSNKNNEKLVGILSSPINQSRLKQQGVILLNTGLNYRIAWHRLNVKIARELSSVGYFVLRFDTHGIGDSEGQLPETSVVNLHVAIETGLFTQDCSAAIDFFIHKTNIKDILLFGVCGGALTAMFTAVHDKRVKGIIHLAGPVTLSSKKDSTLEHPWQAENLFKMYLAKFFNLKAWIKFFSGKTEYKNLFSSCIKVCLTKVEHIKNSRIKLKSEIIEKKTIIDELLNINTQFIKAFTVFKKTAREIIFIFPERDPATWEFKKVFLNQYLKRDAKFTKHYEFYEILNGNHILSDDESQSELLKSVMNWLERKFS